METLAHFETVALAQFIEGHGVTVVTETDGAVTALIPWHNHNTGERGVDQETCRSMADARDALGY